jgi:hypothetical protein
MLKMQPDIQNEHDEHTASCWLLRVQVSQCRLKPVCVCVCPHIHACLHKIHKCGFCHLSYIQNIHMSVLTHTHTILLT